MTHPTAWTATTSLPHLPQKRSALYALYALRQATPGVLVTTEDLCANLEDYHALSGLQTPNTATFDPSASYRPAAFQVLHHNRGQVVTFDDGSALLLRRHGQRYALSNTIAHVPHGPWTDERAAFALEELWTPAHAWPQTPADWDRPATGIERAMPIIPPHDPKRDAAFCTVVDLLWRGAPNTTRPGFEVYHLRTENIVALQETGKASGAALEDDERWSHCYFLLLHAARTIYTGRRASPQVWKADTWSITSMDLRPCVHVPPRTFPSSAHQQIPYLRELHTVRLAKLGQDFPKLHALLTTTLGLTA